MEKSDKPGVDAQRAPTGISGLDEMLDGGLLRNSVAVVKGAPGTGKSCIGMEFIARGIDDYSEPGLIITFEEFPRQLYRDAVSIGFDLRAFERENKLRTVFTTPSVFLREIQQPGGVFDRTIEEINAKRVFVDSMTQLERITQDPVQLREIMYTFLNGLLRYDITALVTQEDAFITGNMSVAEAGLSYIVDTIVQLRYVEISSSMDRALFVLKHRASDHDKRIRRLVITSSGLEVKTTFEGREGILTGNPHITRRIQKAEEFFK
ncbi:MAG: ATPase domain-containing protein [Actinomycetota bacterium]|nr:ATPase domain-containing protein [Actinomycetota bacterium]